MVSAESYGELKRKGMLFGDDNWATVHDEEPMYKNSKGIEMKRYLIQPHPHLIKQYPELQKPGALNHRGYAVWVEYPTYWIDDRNPSRTNAVVRVMCGFDGRETLQTKNTKHLTEEIKMLKQELEACQIANIYLTEENRLLLSEKKMIIKDNAEMASLGYVRRRDYNESGEPGEQ